MTRIDNDVSLYPPEEVVTAELLAQLREIYSDEEPVENAQSSDEPVLPNDDKSSGLLTRMDQFFTEEDDALREDFKETLGEVKDFASRLRRDVFAPKKLT